MKADADDAIGSECSEFSEESSEAKFVNLFGL